MKNEFPIPGRLFEVIDGVLIVLLAIMLLFAIMHIYDLWVQRRSMFGGRYGLFRAAGAIYREYKPSVAFFVIVASLWLRFAILWYLRHLRTYAPTIPDELIRWSIEIFMVANIGLAVGVVCWIRNVSPFPLKNWQWILLIAAALGLGLFLSDHNLNPTLRGTGGLPIHFVTH